MCSSCGLALRPVIEGYDDSSPIIQTDTRSEDGFPSQQFRMSERTPKEQENASHLRWIEKHTSPYSSRKDTLELLSLIQARLHITETVYQRSLWIFDHTVSGWRNRPRILLLLASLIVAARESAFPLLQAELCEFYSYRKMARLNRALTYVRGALKKQTPPLPAISYLSRIVSDLDNNEKVVQRLVKRGLDPQDYLSMIQREARALLNSTNDIRLHGRSPWVLAASSCYMIDHSVKGAQVFHYKSFPGIDHNTLKSSLRLWESIRPDLGSTKKPQDSFSDDYKIVVVEPTLKTQDATQICHSVEDTSMRPVSERPDGQTDEIHPMTEEDARFLLLFETSPKDVPIEVFKRWRASNPELIEKAFRIANQRFEENLRRLRNQSGQT